MITSSVSLTDLPLGLGLTLAGHRGEPDSLAESLS